VQVVCGAPNAHTGMKGVFARPGTVIPVSGEALKISTIRGVESRGMLCSERELAAVDDHDGIIELPADAQSRRAGGAGARPQRSRHRHFAHAQSRRLHGVYGIARDLAAAGLGRLKDGEVSRPGQIPSPIGISLNFRPAAKALPDVRRPPRAQCEERPSPPWVQERLRAIGLRPISALVDVTNLISHRSRPAAACVRRRQAQRRCRRGFAKDGETLLALDGKTYTLDSGCA
jgi:phenylalanyl-tRNA synthetase beta chain